MGAILGSFFATLVVRWPEGTNLGGRSRCDACERSLPPRDLVPVLSGLASRWRCRFCGAATDPAHPLIEMACAAAGAACLAASPGWAGLAGLVMACQLVALAALDWRHFWLPDRLTLALAATGLAAGLAGMGVPIADRAIGGAIGFLALFALGALYRAIRKREGLGGGDAKLLGALGCWLGWQGLPLVILIASASGLLLVLGRVVAGQPVSATDRVPLGAGFALAGLIVWFV